MEIEYSSFIPDFETFGNRELCGIVDKNGTFLYNKIYDIRRLEYNKMHTVKMFLAIDKLKNKDLIDNLFSEFEQNNEIYNKKLKDLSSSELIKVLIIKLTVSRVKVIILEHIDTYLNNRDLANILHTLKTILDRLDKTIIFSTNKMDNIIRECTRYLIASEDHLIYKGTSIEDIPEKTEIMKFVDAANKKKAKLVYYKDASDLLKAIYRSVKK